MRLSCSIRPVLSHCTSLLLCLPDELERRTVEQRDELSELRTTLKSLDRDRDDLQAQVDEKTEDIMSLESRRIQLVSGRA